MTRQRPLRPPSAKSGPLRWGAHAVLGSGRFPTLADWRTRLHASSAPTVRSLRVFAVEPTSIQLDWAALGPGPVTVTAADTTIVVDTNGGPGAVTLDDLPTGRNLTITLNGEGVAETLHATTLRPPPGAEILRIATVSDLHVGETSFGYLHTIAESPDTPPHNAHSLRAARAAVREALDWGAQRLVAKGDIVDQSHPGHWDDIIPIFESAPIPVHLIAGNHEVKKRRSIEPRDALIDTTIHYTERLDVITQPDANVILVNSTIPNHEAGRLSNIEDDLVTALTECDGGALVLLHHHLLAGHALAAWPVGVPSQEANALLSRVAAIHPATMFSSGHVHRNRLRHFGAIPLTSVGSAKDYPGVWAGYVFHEGGIRQVIKRVSKPSVLAWTERTGDALGGFYRHWTPSTLTKRCFTHTWPSSSSEI